MIRASERSIIFINSSFAAWYMYLFVFLLFGPLSTSLCLSAIFDKKTMITMDLEINGLLCYKKVATPLANYSAFSL